MRSVIMDLHFPSSYHC